MLKQVAPSIHIVNVLLEEKSSYRFKLKLK